jgi:hypothetical protein
MDDPPQTTDGQRAGHRKSRLPVALLTGGVLLAVAGGALVGVRLLWPAGRISSSGQALARVVLPAPGEEVSSAEIVLRSGRWVGAAYEAGTVDSLDKLPAGSRVTVLVNVQRSRWIGWLVGSDERLRLVVETPKVALARRLLSDTAASPPELTFTAPVREVSLRFGSGRRQTLKLATPSRRVPLATPLAGPGSAGSALVSATARLWERLPAPVRVSWLPAAPGPEVLVRPAPASPVEPLTPIVLTFSRPVGEVLGTRRPRFWPAVRGTWSSPNPNTLVFQPRGLGFALGATLRLGLTRSLRVLAGSDPTQTRTLTWSVSPAAEQRLAQVLGQLGYLPLAWPGGGDQLPGSASELVRAVISPLTGTPSWRYHAPAALVSLWRSATGRTVILRGAVMAFQSAHDLEPTGEVTPALWRTLLGASLTDQQSPYGYSYVFVTESLPETLTLWHNGRTILQTPINTGIPAAPTALGTYPVYLHLASATMRGINPDGTPYDDPGVPWVNYFNGGDAVHGFVRASYGFPQSLGCVEAPPSTAEQIFPYVQIGTLVTISA